MEEYLLPEGQVEAMLLEVVAEAFLPHQAAEAKSAAEELLLEALMLEALEQA